MSIDNDVVRIAWQAYADACLEHDGRHAKRAAAELTSLSSTPRQRCTTTRTGGRTLAG